MKRVNFEATTPAIKANAERKYGWRLAAGQVCVLLSAIWEQIKDKSFTEVVAEHGDYVRVKVGEPLFREVLAAEAWQRFARLLEETKKLGLKNGLGLRARMITEGLRDRVEGLGASASDPQLYRWAFEALLNYQQKTLPYFAEVAGAAAKVIDMATRRPEKSTGHFVDDLVKPEVVASVSAANGPVGGPPVARFSEPNKPCKGRAATRKKGKKNKKK